LTTSSRTLRPPLPFPTRRSSDLDGVQTAFELAHQFNDGDSNDLALAYGDSVPYRLPMIASGALLQNIPNDHQQQFFATLTICTRSEEHTSELQSPDHLVCRLLLE